MHLPDRMKNTKLRERERYQTRDLMILFNIHVFLSRPNENTKLRASELDRVPDKGCNDNFFFFIDSFFLLAEPMKTTN